jgi:hypothetical protein
MAEKKTPAQQQAENIKENAQQRHSIIKHTAQERAQVAREPTISEVTGALIQKRWGSVLNLTAGEALTVARTICSSFPDWGGWQVVNNFDVLGGTTLYLNVNGYMDIAAAHKMTETPPMWMEIQPNTEEWNKHLGETKPEDIAHACICEMKRRDRDVPFRGFNYCIMDDPLLFDYVGPRGSRTKKRKPDWKPLAVKIAESRAFRRMARFAFSPTEAAMVYAEKKVEAILQEAARKELPKPVLPAADPYSDAEEAKPEVEVEVVRPEQIDDLKIQENDRRRLFSMAERLETAPHSPHNALKMVVAEILEERLGGIVEIDTISTRDITYGMYTEIVERLHEQYPMKDREVEEVEAEVIDDGQETLPL